MRIIVVVLLCLLCLEYVLNSEIDEDHKRAFPNCGKLAKHQVGNCVLTKEGTM